MSGYRISFKRWSNPRRADLDGYNAWDYVDASPDEVFETRKEAQERLRDTKRGKDSEGVNAIFRVVKARSNPGMAKLKFGSPAWRKKYMRKNKPKRKTAQRKSTASHRRGTAAKKKRMGEMIGGVKMQKNPPAGWVSGREFKIVKRGKKTILLTRKER
jgi:hypothetical protein